MNNCVRIPCLLGAAAIAAVLACSSFSDSEKKEQAAGILDYFPSTPGLELAYDFKSQYNPSDDGKREITFQDPPSADEMSFQLTKGSAAEHAICLWSKKGEIIGASNSRQNKYNDGAFRYFFLLNMPSEFSNGKDYSLNGVTYRVETDSSWMSYADCIKISFESPDNFGPPWEQPMLGGTGYFYMARDVGLVHFYFENRGTKNIETFSILKTPKHLAAHRIFGHIQDSTGNPLQNVYVALDTWLPLKWCGKTDAAGNFSFVFYYVAITVYNRGIMVGRDDNGNDILDSGEILTASNYINFPDGDMDLGTMPLN